MLTSFYGVSGFGRILVPINFRLTAAEVAYIIEHSGADVLLADPSLKHVVDAVDCKHKFVFGEDDAPLWTGALTPREWTPEETATATINYTSGTTARLVQSFLSTMVSTAQRGSLSAYENHGLSKRVPKAKVDPPNGTGENRFGHIHRPAADRGDLEAQRPTARGDERRDSEGLGMK